MIFHCFGNPTAPNSEYHAAVRPIDTCDFLR
jgi:hypothetical protein